MSVCIIVLRAVGEHFSSGGYIKGFMEASPEQVSKLAWNIAAPARCTKLVIVANRGYCFGVGFELSLACDFRLASETGFCAAPSVIEPSRNRHENSLYSPEKRGRKDA
jgi:2-oxoglutaroyl-CoA hydrolase